MTKLTTDEQIKLLKIVTFRQNYLNDKLSRYPRDKYWKEESEITKNLTDSLVRIFRRDGNL